MHHSQKLDTDKTILRWILKVNKFWRRIAESIILIFIVDMVFSIWYT